MNLMIKGEFNFSFLLISWIKENKIIWIFDPSVIISANFLQGHLWITTTRSITGIFWDRTLMVWAFSSITTICLQFLVGNKQKQMALQQFFIVMGLFFKEIFWILFPMDSAPISQKKIFKFIHCSLEEMGCLWLSILNKPLLCISSR